MHSLKKYKRSMAGLLILANQEETVARVPHPAQKTTDDTIPVRPELKPDFENVPGYSEFEEAVSRLRVAAGFAEAIRPQTYRVFAIGKLVIDAVRLINFGLREVYKQMSPEMLAEASEKINKQKIIKIQAQTQNTGQTLVASINWLTNYANTMKNLFVKDQNITPEKLSIIANTVPKIEQSVSTIRIMLRTLQAPGAHQPDDRLGF